MNKKMCIFPLNAFSDLAVVKDTWAGVRLRQLYILGLSETTGFSAGLLLTSSPIQVHV